MANYSFGDLKKFAKTSADAAVFLSGLSQLNTEASANETPRVRDKQNWINLRRILENDNHPIHSLPAPDRDISASVSLEDTIEPAPGTSKDKYSKLRDICSEWAVRSGSSHVMLIAHKGKIIFHEAFSDTSGKAPISMSSKIWMASITKLVTGVLLMQFVDKGILQLDEPVSSYLPEIGSASITLRQLMNHTSGLHNAGDWASDWNIALDNQVAQLLPYITSGVEYGYNRAGYALTGRIMERVTGIATPYLFDKNIFNPLGMKSAFCDNTYGGLYCTAFDLAKLGQMLLKKGRYNGFKLLSEKTFKEMLPIKLPFGDRYWGVGTSPASKYGLSGAAFGHGAASGTIFIVDPEKDLIIISARNRVGDYHAEYEKQMIEQVVSLVTDH